jgi:biotin carboxylase
MESKLLHIVGGGHNQLPLIKKAKAMGLRVLLTDMYETSPCRRYSDFFERIDTVDKENTYKAAERHKINYVITDQTDVAVPTVAYIAEKLGLEGIGYETALKFTDKYHMREALKDKLPLNIPEFHFFTDVQQAVIFCNNHSEVSNLLVKPINSQGSKGVARLTNEDYKELISIAFNESKSHGVLIEQFLEGDEYSVEGFKDDTQVYCLALTKKYHYITNDCIDEKNEWMGNIPLEIEKVLFDLNKKVVNALGLPFGITHAEYKIVKGVPYIIEIAARGGGGSISSTIVPFLTGLEPIQALLNKITGNEIPFTIQDYKKRFAILKFFNLRPGKIEKLTIDKDVIKEAEVFTFDLKESDTIKPVHDSRDRPGYFVVCNTDKEALIQLEKRIEHAVHIEYKVEKK